MRVSTIRYRRWAALTAAFTLLACAPERPSDAARRRGEEGAGAASKVVAVVEGEELTAQDFERRLSRLAPYARAQYSERERRVQLLESMVDLELLADEAERRGLGQDPVVLQAMKEAMARLVVADEIRKEVSFDSITREDVEGYVREHAERYTRAEQREALVIGALDADAARTWAQELRALPDVAARLDAASKMASERSVHEPSRASGGEFGWVEAPTKTTRRPEVARALFALELPGDVSSPTKGPGLWWVVVYRDQRAAELTSIDAVEGDVRERIYAERRLRARDALVEKLKKTAKIETYPDVLDAVEPPRGVTSPLDGSVFTPQPTRDLGKAGGERREP